MDSPLVRIQPGLLGKPHPARCADKRRFAGVDPRTNKHFSIIYVNAFKWAHLLSASLYYSVERKKNLLSCEKVLPVCARLVFSKTGFFFCTSLYYNEYNEFCVSLMQGCILYLPSDALTVGVKLAQPFDCSNQRDVRNFLT